MISAEKIGELIKNPQLVQGVSVADISEIKEKFSYCSSLHLLYLKGLAINNDVHFEDQLRYAAAHVMDRERMYYLIHSGAESQKIIEEIPKPIVENKKLIFEQKKEARSFSDETLSLKQVQSDIQSDQKKSEEKIEPKISVEKEIVKSNDKITPTVTAQESDELIEATILPTIVDAVFEKELNALPEKQVEKTISKSEEQKAVEQISSKQKSDQAITKKSVEIELKKEVDLSKLSFVEWLKYKQGQPAQTTTTELKTEKLNHKKLAAQHNVEQPILSSSNQKIESTKSATPDDKIGSRLRVDALLNKFITEEPSISKPKSEFFSPTKTAKQSLEESPDLVTETLAKIYLLQKNYAKAIQAYEQLILVYPEKKTFFVSQIEKIKGEQH